MVMRLRFIVAGLALVSCCSVSLGDCPSGSRADAAGRDGPKSLIRVDITSEKVVTGLKQVLRVWDTAGTVDPGRSLDLVVTDGERRKLAAAGIPFEMVIEDVERAKTRTRAEYHSFPEMEDALEAMGTSYSTITQLTSIGQSWEGREIWCLEISDNPGVDEGEVGVVYMGLHHAREWPALEVPLDIADRLTSGYGSDLTIEALVNAHRIWVIPCVNPDGYVYDHDQGHDWRKNRRYFPEFDTYGVDLNRNYAGSADGNQDGAWGSIGEGSQTHNPSYSTYVGPWPFSELETQAVRDFFDTRNVTISISYHTSGELVLWPWGYDGSVQTDDDALMVSIGQGMAAEITKQSGSGTYTPQQAAALYPTTGSSDDWIYGYRYYEMGKNTLAYTLELATSYHPAASALQQILDENWDGALYVLQQAAGAESQLTPFVLPPILSTPPVDADGDFTVSWEQQNPDAGADTYVLEELTGLSRLTDGAELGTGSWNMEQFSTSTDQSHSGTYSFKAASANELIAAMTTADPLPVEAGDQLSFWTWYDIETDWDMAFVEFSFDGRHYEVLDKFTGSSAGWEQKTYDLDDYVGRSIYLRFRYTTDFFTLEEGFYVDDIYPVASWADSTVTDTSETSYPITGHSDGDYFYRVRGSSPTRGLGEYSDLDMTRVYQYLADGDGDGDHDLHDFADFQLCFGGDGQAVPGTCAVPTAVFDFDLDEDVDLADLSVFAECMTSPDGPTPPECPF